MLRNRRHWVRRGLFHLPGPSIFLKGHLWLVPCSGSTELFQGKLQVGRRPWTCCVACLCEQCGAMRLPAGRISVTGRTADGTCLWSFFTYASGDKYQSPFSVLGNVGCAQLDSFIVPPRSLAWAVCLRHPMPLSVRWLRAAAWMAHEALSCPDTTYIHTYKCAHVCVYRYSYVHALKHEAGLAGGAIDTLFDPLLLPAVLPLHVYSRI